MGILKYKEIIEEGDEIILYLSYNNVIPLKVVRNNTSQTKHGAIRHRELIGQKFGSKIPCVNNKGYVYALHPTPELWTLALPHRTQILYFADISLVTLQLDLRPGSIVLEAGTGSGSLSHSIARTIAPTGHLYTYEFHEKRAEKAAEEFKNHGMTEVVTSSCRDVIQDGFDVSDGSADAVFLDLPSPWLVIPHAKKSLKPSGGRICSFSPCIEQVQRTCEKLAELGFTDITTQECLLRLYDVKTITFPPPNMGLPFTPKGDIQGEMGSENDALGDKVTELKESGIDELGGETNMEDGYSMCRQDDKRKHDGGEVCIKKFKGEGNEETTADTHTDITKGYSEESKISDHGRGNGKTMICSVPSKESPGHTGYLTFASLYVCPS